MGVGRKYQRKPHRVGQDRGRAALPTEAVLWKGKMGKLRLLVPALEVPHHPAFLRRVREQSPASCPAPAPCAFGSAGSTPVPGCSPFPSSGPLPVWTAQSRRLWLVGRTSPEEGQSESSKTAGLVPAWPRGSASNPNTDTRFWEVL